MSEMHDFSRQEALADFYAETMTYDEARRLAELPEEREDETDQVTFLQSTADSEPRRYYGRTAEVSDRAYELAQDLRPSTEVLAMAPPAKGDGYKAAREMSRAIGNKDWGLVRKLLDEESDSSTQDNKVA